MPAVLYVIKDKVQKASNDKLLELIIAEHGAALQRFVRVRVGQKDDADDVVQDVYARLAQMSQLEQRVAGRMDTVRNYLFQIAVNIITDRYRKAVVRREFDHVDADEPSTIYGALGSTLSSPERQLEGKRTLQLIQLALNDVKPELQQAFLLSRMDNMSYREISDTMGVSVSTVEKYISAVLVAIRERVLP
ncbi:RNA polymerase sigma factor [Aliidiomarina quisquiliarum]|uniref:RNA polymerase sigma factor n=1 Tax=Aliidiomarina quisquiliarum TaxID=2938947 RepID=UPI00208F4FB7|nr:sigma-70 family RNA polymerase sigma factor [Aliidiomarina quisquiliarum]MCO4320319.1 sigma-70 family RNA polymerase sigma factor [Aliidiomarina quisquiliarum]